MTTAYVPMSRLGGVELQSMSASTRQGLNGWLDAIIGPGASGAGAANAVQNLQMQYDVDEANEAKKRTAIYVVSGLAVAGVMGAIIWGLTK